MSRALRTLAMIAVVASLVACVPSGDESSADDSGAQGATSSDHESSSIPERTGNKLRDENAGPPDTAGLP
jgi:hypothetical protein